MDAQELTEIERAMEAEHRLDREALERLKRFVHQGRNGHSTVAVAAKDDLKRHDDNETAVVYTIIGKVAAIMTADPSRSWDGMKMLERLKSDGSPVGGGRPASTISRVFRKLAKRGVIRRVRTGKGTKPHVYRAISPPPTQGG